MRTYYFDTQDGVPVRDNKGIDFRRASEAIEHSKKLASDIRDEANKRDRDLTIVVTDAPRITNVLAIHLGLHFTICETAAA